MTELQDPVAVACIAAHPKSMRNLKTHIQMSAVGIIDNPDFFPMLHDRLL